MNKLIKTAVAASLMIGTAATVQPVLAQASGAIVPGIGIANLEAVIANSNAFKTAETQRATTYKAQIDQAEARRTALNTQLKPLVDKFNADSRVAKPNQAALEQQAGAIQALQENGQNELQRILQPVAYSRAYVSEQIEDKLDAAVKTAMAARKISLLLSPQSVIAVNDNAYNLNQGILDALNASIPSAQLVPPAGWEPRQIREQRAQQQGAAQPAAAPAAGQPQGR